ncbi:uncharacterized protein PRCAT00005447001 [Priceomyces carsonii]|uniref:uncharacterized protein n=1 Tax=Priceomyces carsonii TaxID=28549 RepID=UPI002ED85ABC|nr:unnamed protein product [Priceomyces carsonii]
MSGWIETSSGNRISRSAVIEGSERILLSGNTTVQDNVILKGSADITNDEAKTQAMIKIGKFCYLDKQCQILSTTIGDSYGPVQIGAYTIVGERSVIDLAKIGSRVLIESDCMVGKMTEVYDCCRIRSGTTVAPYTTIPPYSEVCGTPGIDFEIKPLHNCYKKLIEIEARQRQILM